MSVLLWLLNNPLVSAALAAFFAFIFGTMKGRIDGGARERAKRAAEELKAAEERLEMNREATDIEKRIRGMTDADLDKEVGKWSRG